MILYYVRHADPIYNPDSLTPLGLRQAEAAGRRLAQRGISRIFSSTSHRAVLTATPLSELTGKPVEELDWCHEKHAGETMTATDPKTGGRTWCFNIEHYRRLFCSREVRALGLDWYRHEAFADMAFAQGIQQANECCDEFLLSLGYRHDREAGIYLAENPTSDRIALFAHQGYGFLFLSALLDIPYPWLCTHTDITRSSITAIEFNVRDGFVIPRMLSMSGDGHLYADRLPTHV